MLWEYFKVAALPIPLWEKSRDFSRISSENLVGFLKIKHMNVCVFGEGIPTRAPPTMEFLKTNF